jgi:hypothetical protein
VVGSILKADFADVLKAAIAEVSAPPKRPDRRSFRKQRLCGINGISLLE